MRSTPFLKKFNSSVLKGCGVNPVVEYFFHTFSLLIPKGEGFFMRSVRVAARQIEDAPLKEGIKIFLIQESNHSKVHDEFNNLLAKNYPFVVGFDEKYSSMLPFWVYRGDRHELTCTLCLEYLTYILARMILRGKLLDRTHPTVRDFWYWHAYEEVIHKSIVHKIYNKLGMGYFRRCLTMIWIAIPLVYLLRFGMTQFMHSDRLSRWVAWKHTLSFLFMREKFALILAFKVLYFFSPWFNPESKVDSDVLLTEDELARIAGVDDSSLVMKSS